MSFSSADGRSPDVTSSIHLYIEWLRTEKLELLHSIQYAHDSGALEVVKLYSILHCYITPRKIADRNPGCNISHGSISIP